MQTVEIGPSAGYANSVREPKPKSLDWINILFLTITPLIAVFGTAAYVYFNGIHWVEIAAFLVLAFFVSIGVTGGYHRYYSHRSHDCHPIVQLFYLIWGAAAVENAVLDWASDHRYHHKYVDREEDPYNIMKGGLYAHIGWIFFKDERGQERYDNSPDLLKDPLVMWQKRHYLALVGLTTIVIPIAIGLAIGRPWGGFLWGGIVRVVVMQHMTFFVNSWAHMFGSRPYSLDNSARDCWWLAFVTSGEGYHNFHHKFPSDYRNGVRWYHWDPTKWFLGVMYLLGLSHRLNRTSNFTILRTRLDVEAKSAELKLRSLSESHWDRFQHQLQSQRKKLSELMAEYHEAKARYIELKRTASEDMAAQMRAKIRECEQEFQAAREQWAQFLKSLRAVPAAS